MFREAAAAGKAPKMELISQEGGSQESLQALNTLLVKKKQALKMEMWTPVCDGICHQWLEGKACPSAAPLTPRVRGSSRESAAADPVSS